MPISSELRQRIDSKQLTSQDYSALYILSRQKDEPLADRITAAKIAWEHAENRKVKVTIIAKDCHDYYLELAREDGTNRNFNEMKEFMKTLPDSVVDALMVKLGHTVRKDGE